MKKFDLIFIYSTHNVSHQKIGFRNLEEKVYKDDIDTVEGVRSWFNVCGRFVNIGSQIHNLDRVDYIDVRPSKL